ncbi:MAG: ABC transporter permease [Micromonosporaceae bacterium]|nr:ABC transporter permease [Micromonosporaceae bacterium]
MAYDNSPYGRHDDDATESVGLASAGPSRYLGQTGFRDEPDLHATSAAYQPAGYAAGYGESGSVLDDIFDDPAAGEPGRDRLAVHWVWEVLLLVGVVTLVYLVWQAQPDALRGDSLSLLLTYATGFGLLGIAAGVSLRAGAPNLAIGPVAAAAGAYFALHGDRGVVSPAIFALAVAVLLGLAVAVLVMVFHVPGWAATLAAAAGAVVWLQQQPAQVPVAGEYDPTGQAAFLFALVAAVSILGGLLGTVKPMRRAIGRFRPTADPARRRGGLAALLTGGALVLSMALSVVAGVLLVAGEGGSAQGSAGVNWLEWTVIGLGAALVGGTSAFGRRGGVFGTILAVTALVLFDRYQQEQGWQIALLATAAGLVAAGLVVTRLVETFGRPRPGSELPEPSERWESTAATAGSEPPATSAGGWPSAATDSWSSALPARPVAGTPDPWDDDRWRR